MQLITENISLRQLTEHPPLNIQKIEPADYPTIKKILLLWAKIARQKTMQAIEKGFPDDRTLFQDSNNLIRDTIDALDDDPDVTLYGYKNKANKFRGFSALIFLGFSHRDSTLEPYIKIEALFTKPTNIQSPLNKKKRILGIGKTLALHAEALAYENKLSGVVLNSFPTTVGFYTKMGYEETRLHGLYLMLKTSEKIKNELSGYLKAA